MRRGGLMLDCDRFDDLIVAKQWSFAFSNSRLSFEDRKNKRLWWRAQCSR